MFAAPCLSSSLVSLWLLPSPTQSPKLQTGKGWKEAWSGPGKHFSGLHFLAQDLSVPRSRSSRRHIHPLGGFRPLWETWPAANLTSLPTWLWSRFILQLIWWLIFPSGLWAPWGKELCLFILGSSRPDGAWYCEWLLNETFSFAVFLFDCFLQRTLQEQDSLVKRQGCFWDLILLYHTYLCLFPFHLQGRGSLLLISLLSSAPTLIDLLLRNQ